MTNCRRALACVIVILTAIVGINNSTAQSVRTEHTYRLDNPEAQPSASLTDVDWLIGSWHGEAFGNTFEEVWNAPSAGSMVGMFKVLDGDTVQFYELMLLVEEEGSLNLKVKHFTKDFVAWETKEDHVTFRLVNIEDGVINFSGLSFQQINDDEIHAYIALHDDEKVWEEKLTYRRAP